MPEMLDLFVLEHLIDRIDRATGHAGGVELPDPGMGRFLLSQRVDLDIERIAVLGTCRCGGVFGVGHELGRARRRRTLSREEGEDLILRAYTSENFREGMDAFPQQAHAEMERKKSSAELAKSVGLKLPETCGT